MIQITKHPLTKINARHFNSAGNWYKFHITIISTHMLLCLGPSASNTKSKGLDQQPKNRKISYARKGKNKAEAGRPLSYSENLDMELCQWVLEMCDLHLPIQRKHIQRKAITLIQPTHPSFKASVGWLAKFLTRHSLTLRHQTSIQLKLPAQLEAKLTQFFN